MDLLTVLLALGSAAPHPRAQDAPAAPRVPLALVELARARAARPFEAEPGPELPEALAELDYDAYRRIRFRPEHSLWREDGRLFQVQPFHRGYLFDDAVALSELAGGEPRDVPYVREAWDFDGLVPEGSPSGPLGFAGFRVLYPLHLPEKMDEVAVFLGASYFRLLGEGQIFGASARGLAIGTGSAEGEEFPRFVAFRLQRPEVDARHLELGALLDSPSVAGAFAFRIEPGPETVATVSAVLFPRRPLDRLGLAPLTSMFWYGEGGERSPPDYRPEVHDSDGLLVRLATGEWIWTPLTNPRRTHRVTRTETGALLGFGLMQRDRAFESYQDLESHFERRPSLWVEPIGGWAPGAVELIEIPTEGEANDNVVALWAPREPVPRASEGGALELAYRVRATTADAVMHPLLRVRASRRARVGEDVQRFVIDFVGDLRAAGAPEGQVPTAQASAGGAELRAAQVLENAPVGGWRVVLDVVPGDAPAELELRLVAGGRPVSEFWRFVLRAPEDA